MRDVAAAEVEEAIQPGGLHRQKSVRIQQILRALPDPPDLAFLAELPVAEARDYLTALPGVGRKTAACVLLFAFGMPDVPVDTHVSRVGTRLGLFRARRPLRGAPRRDARADAARAGSSSYTSTCCATGAAPATPSARPAASARCSGCAPMGASWLR